MLARVRDSLEDHVLLQHSNGLYHNLTYPLPPSFFVEVESYQHQKKVDVSKTKHHFSPEWSVGLYNVKQMGGYQTSRQKGLSQRMRYSAEMGGQVLSVLHCYRCWKAPKERKMGLHKHQAVRKENYILCIDTLCETQTMLGVWKVTQHQLSWLEEW